MKGRIWLLVGIAVGVAVGVGKLAYFAGAATSLSDTAQRLVGSGGHTLVRSAAGHGASRRTLNAITAVAAVVVPGVTALLLIYAARATLHLRAVVALVMAGLGVAAFFYLPHGVAAGAAVLAFVAAGIAVAATGPLVAAPLAALAALIATEFLPRILASHSTLPNVPVVALNQAIFAGAGSPVWLRVVVLVLAALPFALAARLVVR
ncbi:MAG: hypothetical protein ABSF89_03455 [Acidimicrobiales bacterium]|jgi:hypothetical protein